MVFVTVVGGGGTHTEAPPASTGLRFQPFRELGEAWHSAEMVKLDFWESALLCAQTTNRYNNSSPFCLWLTLSGCTGRCKPAVVFGNNYITDALAAVSKSFQSLPGIGYEDFILVDWSWVNPQRLYQIRRRGWDPGSALKLLLKLLTVIFKKFKQTHVASTSFTVHLTDRLTS